MLERFERMPLSLAELEKYGKRVEPPAVGAAYKWGNDVYRVPGNPAGYNAWGEVWGRPERVARLWNEFYNKGYGGLPEFQQYAKASAVQLPDGTNLTRTPFIRGKVHFADEMVSLQKALADELRDEFGRTLIGRQGGQDIKVVAGKPAIVNFDAAQTINPGASATWQEWERVALSDDKVHLKEDYARLNDSTQHLFDDGSVAPQDGHSHGLTTGQKVALAVAGVTGVGLIATGVLAYDDSAHETHSPHHVASHDLI